MTRKPKTVDAYIASVPRAVQGQLKALRAAIRAAAPDSEERISYSMPYYHYKGRLAYFRLSTHHIGLYIPTPVLERHKRDLKDYSTTGATLRIPLGERIPVGLVKKLLKTRMRMNEKGAASE